MYPPTLLCTHQDVGSHRVAGTRVDKSTHCLLHLVRVRLIELTASYLK